MQEAITWGHVLFGNVAHLMEAYGIDPHPAIDATIISVVLIVLAWIGGRRFRRTDMLEPDGHVTMAFVMSLIISRLEAFFDGMIHHGSRGVFFMLGTFSFFILGNNLVGLVPGFNPPTDQFNVTIVLALMVFFTAHYLGIKTHGPAYIKKFMGPIWWLAPLMFPIELISHLVRPLSLSVRLFGNMTGDHKVVAMFTAMVALGLPLPFMGLGIFISILQTFVFVLLACIYFQDALEEAH